MINFQQLITPSYVFSTFVGPLNRSFFIVWIVIGIVLFFGGLAWRIDLAKRRGAPAWTRWYRRVATMASTMGFVALVLLFFRYERIPTLSMRFWLYLWLLAALVWAAILARDLWKRVPREMSQWSDRQRIEKYLPKH